MCALLPFVVPFPPLNAGPCCPDTSQQPLPVVPHTSHLILQPIKFIWPSHRTRWQEFSPPAAQIWKLQPNPDLRAASPNHGIWTLLIERNPAGLRVFSSWNLRQDQIRVGRCACGKTTSIMCRSFSFRSVTVSLFHQAELVNYRFEFSCCSGKSL